MGMNLAFDSSESRSYSCYVGVAMSPGRSVIANNKC